MVSTDRPLLRAQHHVVDRFAGWHHGIHVLVLLDQAFQHRRAIVGEEPTNVKFIAVMIDGDNTKSKGTAYFGPIQLWSELPDRFEGKVPDPPRRHGEDRSDAGDPAREEAVTVQLHEPARRADLLTRAGQCSRSVNAGKTGSGRQSHGVWTCSSTITRFRSGGSLHRERRDR